MKIYGSEWFNLFLDSEKEITKIENNIFSCPSSFNLIICGKTKIIWPNREGEGFNIEDVFPVLMKTGFLKEGVSIAWPATAFAQAVFFPPANIMFCTDDDKNGCYREIRIFADSPERVRIKFTGLSCKWQLKQFENKILQNIKTVAKSVTDYSFQFQLGMKDTNGKTQAKEGFKIVEGLLERFERQFKTNNKFPNILHLFAIGAGHDLGYPDYSPAKDLGGKFALHKAADIIHKRGLLLSCYINARIAQKETLCNYPKLLNEKCYYPNGEAVIETYHNRTFFVMNPNSEPWQEHLLKQAKILKDCGADAVQLDQVAGRAPVTKPGLEWGHGYLELIKKIKDENLRVWIQGVSNYYPADWFEMTQRDVKILNGGILRGGNPFGDTDILLLKLLSLKRSDEELLKNKKRYIVPNSKISKIKDYKIPLIIDLLGDGGRLPVYNKEYLDELRALELLVEKSNKGLNKNFGEK